MDTVGHAARGPVDPHDPHRAAGSVFTGIYVGNTALPRAQGLMVTKAWSPTAKFEGIEPPRPFCSLFADFEAGTEALGALGTDTNMMLSLRKINVVALTSPLRALVEDIIIDRCPQLALARPKDHLEALEALIGQAWLIRVGLAATSGAIT